MGDLYSRIVVIGGITASSGGCRTIAHGSGLGESRGTQCPWGRSTRPAVPIPVIGSSVMLLQTVCQKIDLIPVCAVVRAQVCCVMRCIPNGDAFFLEMHS